MQQENAFKNKQKYTSPEGTELKSGQICTSDKYYPGPQFVGISLVIFIGSAGD